MADNTNADLASPTQSVPAEGGGAPQVNEDLVRKWLAEIDSALKREKKWRKKAREALKIYEADKPELNPFPILYSNTETLSPALFNATPRPVVQRRFKDADPLGAAAAKAGQRTLEFLIDDGSMECTPFEGLMQETVLAALLPGRGTVRVQYEPTFENQGTEAESLAHETVYLKKVSWDRICHGYARHWDELPWLAYMHIMDLEELRENFGKEIAAEVEITPPEHTDWSRDEDDSSTGQLRDPKDNSAVKTALVWEIWDKATKKVLFVSQGYTKGPLKEVGDPLELSGFFPSPAPLRLFARLDDLIPVTLYTLYEQQAKELNKITVRIGKIVEALKVRGYYDAALGETIAELLSAEDNVLLPAEANSLRDGSSMDKAIWLMPLEKLSATLQQLFVHRQQCKQVIYEITGISDILRGASVASETATAQEIKNQWGTLRLKRMQKVVSNFARDCLRLLLELAVSKLSPETLKAMTGLPFPMQAEVAQADAVAAQFQQEGQQPPPELVEQYTKLKSMPTWEAIQELLQNDLQRAYRVDIETNSTVDVEATEDKQNVSEVLNAMAQLLSGIGPLVENGTLPFDVAKQMMLAVVRRFRFGTEIEDSLNQMAAPQPKSDPAEEAKAKQMEQQMQLEQAKGQMQLQGIQAKSEAESQKIQGELQLMQAQIQLKQAELQIKMQELELDKQRLAMEQQSLGLENERLTMQDTFKRKDMQRQDQMAEKRARQQASGQNRP